MQAVCSIESESHSTEYIAAAGFTAECPLRPSWVRRSKTWPTRRTSRSMTSHDFPRPVDDLTPSEGFESAALYGGSAVTSPSRARSGGVLFSDLRTFICRLRPKSDGDCFCY